jgi:hypothetical protein
VVEWFMIFALGFLTGILIALAFLPHVHARAARLAARRMMREAPIAIAEVYADRDALRVQFAVAARRLEMRIDELTAKLAKTRAELGRKSDEINRLNELARLAQARTVEDYRPLLGESLDELDGAPLVPESPHEQPSLRKRLAELERAETVSGFTTSPEVEPTISCGGRTKLHSV